MREEEEWKQCKASFKQYLFEQEKIKKLKLKIARNLRQALGSTFVDDKYSSIFKNEDDNGYKEVRKTRNESFGA